MLVLPSWLGGIASSRTSDPVFPSLVGFVGSGAMSWYTTSTRTIVSALA